MTPPKKPPHGVATTRSIRRIAPSRKPARRVSHAKLAAALGAEPVTRTAALPQSPLPLLGLHQEMSRRLASSGGRPRLDGTTRRQKIPLQESDWHQLTKLASILQDETIHPTPAQVASVLLHQLLEQLQPLSPEKARRKLSAILQAAEDAKQT